MDQTINERQRQELSTCMPSCQNFAYPVLGLFGETAEFAEKLKYLIEWNDKLTQEQRSRMEMFINGIALERMAKELRHQPVDEQIIPFRLKHLADSSHPDFLSERINALRKEGGDIKWMLDALDFYIVNPDGTNPTTSYAVMTAQDRENQNYHKLSERAAIGMIDAQGDDQRTTL